MDVVCLLYILSGEQCLIQYACVCVLFVCVCVRLRVCVRCWSTITSPFHRDHQIHQPQLLQSQRQKDDQWVMKSLLVCDTYTHTHTHTHTHTCTHTHIYIHTYTYTHNYTHIYHTRTCSHTHTHTHTQITKVRPSGSGTAMQSCLRRATSRAVLERFLDSPRSLSWRFWQYLELLRMIVLWGVCVCVCMCVCVCVCVCVSGSTSD